MKKILSRNLLLATFIGLFGLLFTNIHTVAASSTTTINVTAPNNTRPYNYAKGSGIGGYYGELLKKIDKDLPGYKFKYYTTSQNSVFVGLQSGKYDLAASNWWYSKDRFKNYLHSKSNGLDELVIISKKGKKNINSLREIADRNLKLAPISTDDARYNVIETYNKKNPKHKISLQGIGDQSAGDAIKQIAQGKYDALIYPYAIYKETSNTASGKKVQASKSIGLENSYFLLNKNAQNKKLVKAIDKELEHLKENGYLEKITKKYLHADTFKVKGASKAFNGDPTR